MGQPSYFKMFVNPTKCWTLNRPARGDISLWDRCETEIDGYLLHSILLSSVENGTSSHLHLDCSTCLIKIFMTCHLLLGTGKTLSLLCAALAWREAYVASLQLRSSSTNEGSDFLKETQETLDLAVGFGLSNMSQAIPKIIYASRTHSQLSQAVSELKNTSYKPKISVLGSRDQMCINQSVTRLEDNNAKVYACRVKISSRSCMFYNNVEANKSNKDFKNEILDIEDICKLGNKHAVCPYFMSRELRTDADLIFMPYNYVLDFKLRQTNSIDLKNAIILLDEAHNVEKTCEDAASFELSSYDLASAQADCDECHKILEEKSAAIVGFDEGPAPESAITLEDAMKLKEIFNKLERVVMEPVLTSENPKMVAGSEFLYDALKRQNITASTVGSIIDAIEQCNTLLASQANMGLRRKNFALPKISEILKTLFCYHDQPSDLNYERGRFYKVVIRQEKMKSQYQNQIDIWNQKPGNDKGSVSRTLNYWCFHAGVSMKEIMAQGVRSLILTSGTLSPLESFTSELDVPFPVTLQNPHVIGSSQIWAGIITKGPDGVELNSSYQKRSTSEYQNSLGNLLVNLSRSTPHGLLVFFPSYVLMDEMIKRWNENGILSRIAHNKPHFAEPRDKRSLGTQMEMFYEKINDPAYKGAVFFAVCRGKVSEGLDFADRNGRVVVITGLPYPPKMDAKVELKMKFLDGKQSTGRISGRQWYSQQASRAVNQAIGRVIRHYKDYGAILLCDIRFSYPDAIGRLPVWIKQHIKTFNEFGVAHRNLILFFNNVERMFSPAKAKTSNQCEGGYSGVSRKCGAPSSNSRASATQKGSSPSIAFNSCAENSLAAIKADEGPLAGTSLFHSLSDSNIKDENIKGFERKQKISSAIIGSSTDVVKPRCKTKKVKIIANRSREAPNDENEERKKQREDGGTKSQRGNAGVDMEAKEAGRLSVEDGSKHVPTAKQYIMKVRSVLSKQEYDRFAKILLNYSKKEDMASVIEDLTQLFKEKPHHVHLFRGFENFVKKEKDKELFHAACDQLVSKISLKDQRLQKVGQSFGHSTSEENFCSEPASKKQKISVESKNIEMARRKIPVAEFFPTLSDDDSECEVP